MLLNQTKSVCPKCFTIIKAIIVEENNKVYLQKECPNHGAFKALHLLEKPHYYKTMEKVFRDRGRGDSIVLLINLTFDCNQHCNVCFAEANERRHFTPTIQEIIEETRYFKGSFVYLCGGEPTLREDLAIIIKELKKRGFMVVLMTNGKKLIDNRYVKELEDAGLDSILLQFDTFDDDQYKILRQEELLNIKIKAIENIKQTKILISFWIMVVKGVNDNQIDKIIKYVAQNSYVIKEVFIAPVWSEGRTFECEPLSKEGILKIFAERFNIFDKDFLDYTIFEYYFFEIYNLITNRKLISATFCNMRCRCFYLNGTIMPLTQLINLEKVNYYLERSYNILKSKSNIKKLKIFIKIPYMFFIKEFFLKKQMRSFTIKAMKALVLSFLYRSIPITMDSRSFYITIAGLMNRLNLDFWLVTKNCNTATNFNGRLTPFCIGEIFRKK